MAWDPSLLQLVLLSYLLQVSDLDNVHSVFSVFYIPTLEVANVV